MESGKEAALAWEKRWATPAGLCALAAVAFVIGAIVVASNVVGSGDGDSELLRNAHAHEQAQMISSILQAIGVGLLAVPLYYLFRAARERSDAVRGQLVGVVIAAPLFLAALAILSGVSTLEAASDFVTKELPQLVAKGVGQNSDRANEVASDAIKDASLRSLAAGFGLGGQLGFVIAMVYTCLHAMRTGLLTRFWGSLGMALGAVSFIFFQFALLWFLYLAVLFLGRVPGGKPPAWASGEAEPWPTPAEKAAAEMAGPAPGEEAPPELGEGASDPEAEAGSGDPGPPRKKRKQRE